MATDHFTRGSTADVLHHFNQARLDHDDFSGPNFGHVSRRLNVMRVRGGRVVEARGGVKAKP